MTVVVKLNPRAKTRHEKWIVKDGEGRGAGGRIVGKHRKKTRALSQARLIADAGEKIKAQNAQTGRLRVVRRGR